MKRKTQNAEHKYSPLPLEDEEIATSKSKLIKRRRNSNLSFTAFITVTTLMFMIWFWSSSDKSHKDDLTNHKDYNYNMKITNKARNHSKARNRTHRNEL